MSESTINAEISESQFQGHRSVSFGNLIYEPQPPRETENWIDVIKGAFSSAKNVFRDAFRTKRRVTQEDCYFALYGTNGYKEKIDRKNYQNVVNVFSLVIDTFYLKQHVKGKTMSDREGDFFQFDENLIDSYGPEVVPNVFEYWCENKATVQLTSIYPVFENKELRNLILDLEIDFITQNEPHLSRLISQSFKDLKNFTKIVVPGNPNLGNTSKNQANMFAEKIGPLLDEMTSEGIKSVRQKASELNKREILTLRGKKWDHNSVQRVISRWKNIRHRNYSKLNKT